MLVQKNLFFYTAGNKLSALLVFFIFLFGPSIYAHGFQTTVDFKMTQVRTNLITLDSNQITSYAGPGYTMELTFRLFNPSIGKTSNIQPGLNLFLFGGTSN